MKAGKSGAPRVYPTLVFDAESFIHKDRQGRYIPLGISGTLVRLSQEFNMIAVFPREGKYRAALKKFINRGKEERIFPAPASYCSAEEVEFLLKKHHSPLIFFNKTTQAFEVISSAKRLPFTADSRDFKRLLLHYDVSTVPVELHLKKPVDLRGAYLRRKKDPRFVEKFKWLR